MIFCNKIEKETQKLFSDLQLQAKSIQIKFLCIDLTFNLKELSYRYYRYWEDRVRNEAKHLAHLDHINIVQYKCFWQECWDEEFK